jgi:hypothetical protein
VSDNELTGEGKAVATDKVTYSGDADQNIQLVRMVGVSGVEGSKIVLDLPADESQGMGVYLSTAAMVEGDAAHGASDTGNPLKIGGRAYDGETTPTPVDLGERVDGSFTAYGALHTTLVSHDNHEHVGVSGGSLKTYDDAVAGRVEDTNTLLTNAESYYAGIESATAATRDAVQIVDDWDESDRAKVNPIVGQAGLQGASGVVSANTLRVVLATDVSPPLPIGAATAFIQNDTLDVVNFIQTSVQIMDDWDESDRAKVNIISGQAGVAAGAGAVSATVQRVTLASDDVGVAYLTAINAELGNVGVDISDLSGGWTYFNSIDIDETEEQIKATGGRVGVLYAFNRSASIMYLKFYDATAASVTVGSTTPVLVLPIPSGSGFTWNLSPQGMQFGTAITVAATTGVANSDTGAPATNDVLVNVGYK